MVHYGILRFTVVVIAPYNCKQYPIICMQLECLNSSILYRRGPLVRNWAMRFEAKHSYFKNVAGIVNNFKNIDLSLARRHQALQAYLLQGKLGSLTKPLLEHGPGMLNLS
jgi:hypothetical protein